MRRSVSLLILVMLSVFLEGGIAVSSASVAPLQHEPVAARAPWAILQADSTAPSSFLASSTRLYDLDPPTFFPRFLTRRLRALSESRHIFPLVFDPAPASSDLPYTVLRV